VGYQIICIYFNHSSGKQIGFIKFTRLRASIFFSIVEKGGRRVDIALDLCPTTESLSLSNFYLIAVMWHIKKYLIDLGKPMDNTLDL
jgi:hypothetical protein